MTDWTLAIETVATAGSVALLQAGELREQCILPEGSRSARTLAAGIREVWSNAGKPAISLVAVASGPGSFTGLRVGITTAKALAYAWQAKVIGVSTLDACAAQVPVVGSAASLQVVLDAQRKELFVATYNSLGPEWQRSTADLIVSADAWLANLSAGAVVSGPALNKLRNRLPEQVQIAPDLIWQPQAATIGRLGWQAHLAGSADELWSLVPQYLRPSYAEEARKPGDGGQETGDRRRGTGDGGQEAGDRRQGTGERGQESRRII